VLFVTIDMFIVEVTILEIDLLDQSTFDEKGNGSVDRRPRNDLFLVPQSQKKLIHVKVIVNRENLLDNRLPFRGVAKSLVSDKCTKFSNLVHNDTIIVETQFQ